MKTIAILRFNTEETILLRESQMDHLKYHFERLLRGEPTSVDEWSHLGVILEYEEDVDQGDE